MKLIRIYKVPYVIKRSVSSFHFDEKSLIIYEKKKKNKKKNSVGVYMIIRKYISKGNFM